MTGCDMAAALPGAVSGGAMLFAHNSNRPAGQGQALLWAPGQNHAAGESVRVQYLTLPQVRRTHALIGARPAGVWGCLQGVNEYGVAMGATPTRTRLANDGPGLTGADLVRLTLERAAGARQAVDTAADLIARHGQGRCASVGARSGDRAPTEDNHDNAFLIADGREAHLLAACGGHWAVQQIGAVRALNGSCHLRQDWDRISPGLAGLAIRRGWWPEDGSKLDFAGALAEPEAGRQGYRWWGRATMLLEQHRGAIDHELMRRLLAEPSRTENEDEPPTVTVGLIAQVGPVDAPPLAWFSFGPAGCGLYFPLPVVAEPPPAFRAGGPDAEGCDLWRRMTRDWLDRPVTAESRAALAELQAHFDLTAGEFTSEAAALRRRGDSDGLARLAQSFAQSNWERFEEVWEAASGKEAAWETACRMDAV